MTAIWEYLVTVNARAADKVVDEITAMNETLAEFPRMGVQRDELNVGWRVFPVGKYLIVYREIPDGVEIVHVVHGARDLPTLFASEES